MTLEDYFPHPKVVAAFLSALLVVVLLTLGRAVNIEVGPLAQTVLTALGAGAGGYAKSE